MYTRPIDVVRAGYERYARRDFAGVFELLAPDVEITQTPELPWGGVHRGHAGARVFFGALNEHTEAVPQPERYVEAGEDVVALGRLRGRARSTGWPIDLEIVHVWTVRDGRIARFCAYIDTPAMLQALGRSALERPAGP